MLRTHELQKKLREIIVFDCIFRGTTHNRLHSVFSCRINWNTVNLRSSYFFAFDSFSISVNLAIFIRSLSQSKELITANLRIFCAFLRILPFVHGFCKLSSNVLVFSFNFAICPRFCSEKSESLTYN